MPDTTSPSNQSAASYTIGAIGHRNLAGLEQAIVRQIAFVLRQLIDEHPNERLSLLSSVAEGADRLLLASAAELGLPYDCVLPCSPECFRVDFASPDSRGEFDRLLETARSVMQPEMPFDKEEGYLWASEAVLARADTLLAVWDGGSGNGAAGTAETVARARKRGIPVIWIPTEPPHTVQVLEPGVGTAR